MPKTRINTGFRHLCPLFKLFPRFLSATHKCWYFLNFWHFNFAKYRSFHIVFNTFSSKLVAISAYKNFPSAWYNLLFYYSQWINQSVHSSKTGSIFLQWCFPPNNSSLWYPKYLLSLFIAFYHNTHITIFCQATHRKK